MANEGSATEQNQCRFPRDPKIRTAQAHEYLAVPRGVRWSGFAVQFNKGLSVGKKRLCPTEKRPIQPRLVNA